ncbi:MAG: hypothetical protein SynsKO_07670 [Synoicihabitans sp.]
MRTNVVHYQMGAAPVIGVGFGVSKEDLDSELSGPTAALIFDQRGVGEIRDLVAGVADTQFSKDNLDDLLGDDGEPEDWEVGEALAERYLTENHGCMFPWPDGRDKRKRTSSLPGADLVGFKSDFAEHRFAFGEVKTSLQESYPPSAVSGPHGLKKQMEDLRDKKQIRDDLVRYLGHRAHRADWRVEFLSATAKYLASSNDIRLYGLLIRDVPPDPLDLRARVTALDSGCPPSTQIRLCALYFPQGSISEFASKVVDSRSEGRAE